MLFMCDDVKKLWPEDYGFLTKFIDAPNWTKAEQIAEARGLTLVGQFTNWVCEETGEREYIQ
jgi:hypothetical protein